MRPFPTRSPHLILPLVALLTAVHAAPAFAADDPPPDSPLVKMLKGGKLPEERQATVVEMLGKRGGPADLGFLFQQAILADGFPAAVRLKALQALSDAALTRQTKPAGDLAKLGPLIKSREDPTLRLAAIRLAGFWKSEGSVADLMAVARSNEASEPLRRGGRDDGHDRQQGQQGGH